MITGVLCCSPRNSRSYFASISIERLGSVWLRSTASSRCLEGDYQRPRQHCRGTFASFFPQSRLPCQTTFSGIASSHAMFKMPLILAVSCFMNHQGQCHIPLSRTPSMCLRAIVLMLPTPPYRALQRASPIGCPPYRLAHHASETWCGPSRCASLHMSSGSGFVHV